MPISSSVRVADRRHPPPRKHCIGQAQSWHRQGNLRIHVLFTLTGGVRVYAVFTFPSVENEHIELDFTETQFPLPL